MFSALKVFFLSVVISTGFTWSTFVLGTFWERGMSGNRSYNLEVLSRTLAYGSPATDSNQVRPLNNLLKVSTVIHPWVIL